MTRSRASLELALAEAIHRARNDIHAISVLLRLQALAADGAARQALERAASRVDAMASLNARLDEWGEELGQVDFRKFLAGVAADIDDIYMDDRPIGLTVEADPGSMPADTARVLGLIINELVANALKYAFPGERAGAVTILYQQQAREWMLTVRDDGIGFDPNAAPRGSGIGSKVVRALAQQINADFTIAPGQPSGTVCRISRANQLGAFSTVANR